MSLTKPFSRAILRRIEPHVSFQWVARAVVDASPYYNMLNARIERCGRLRLSRDMIIDMIE